MIRTAIGLVADSSIAEANALVRQQDFVNAKVAYEQCIHLESDNSAAWYGLGVVNHQMGDEEAAIVAFERAFLLNRYHAPTAANLAVLFESRDTEAATKYAKAALDLGLENDLLSAIAISTEEEIEQSSEEVASIQVDSEESDDVEHVESEPILIASSVPSEIPTIESEVIQESDDLSSLTDQVRILLDNNSFEEALNMISPALEGEFGAEDELWYLCGSALASLGLIEDATNTLNYCLELNHQHEQAAALLAQISLEQDSDKTAELSNEDETSTFAEPSELLDANVVEYSDETQTEIFDDREPEPEAEPEIVESPFIALEDSKVVLARQAAESSEAGDHATAVQTWKKIIEEFGSTSYAWNGMANALEAAGHIEKAEQCRGKADELEAAEQSEDDNQSVDLVAAAMEAKEQVSMDEYSMSDDVNVAIEWYNKGLTLLAENKGIEALNSFEKSIASAPREERELRVRAHNGRGHALHQLGQFAESIQSYHQAISMDPSMVSGRTLYNMGSSYGAMEHFQDAIRCFEQALERDLDAEEKQLCQTQLNRCSLLLKEQMKAQRLQA